jgi:FMN phosphatase YigB (HAD superfamily)
VIKRIIFDLDRTLIPWLSEWDLMVEKTYNDFNIPFEKDDFNKFHATLLEYEKSHRRFDKVEMSRYFRDNLDRRIPDNFVEVWTRYLSDCVPDKDDKLINLLEYLSGKYSLVIATNWFKDQQLAKLEKFGILKYFDFVLTCDEYDKKPNSEMFRKSCKGFDKDEVVMVGDTYKSDIKSAMDFGLYSYYLTDSDVRRSKRFKVINSIYELDKYL